MLYKYKILDVSLPFSLDLLFVGFRRHYSKNLKLRTKDRKKIENLSYEDGPPTRALAHDHGTRARIFRQHRVGQKEEAVYKSLKDTKYFIVIL